MRVTIIASCVMRSGSIHTARELVGCVYAGALRLRSPSSLFTHMTPLGQLACSLALPVKVARIILLSKAYGVLPAGLWAASLLLSDRQTVFECQRERMSFPSLCSLYPAVSFRSKGRWKLQVRNSVRRDVASANFVCGQCVLQQEEQKHPVCLMQNCCGGWRLAHGDLALQAVSATVSFLWLLRGGAYSLDPSASQPTGLP